MVSSWDGSSPIPVDSDMGYVCDRGMKAVPDFALNPVVSATCRQGNSWEEPTDWKKCVESKGCRGDVVHCQIR